MLGGQSPPHLVRWGRFRGWLSAVSLTAPSLSQKWGQREETVLNRHILVWSKCWGMNSPLADFPTNPNSKSISWELCLNISSTNICMLWFLFYIPLVTTVHLWSKISIFFLLILTYPMSSLSLTHTHTQTDTQTPTHHEARNLTQADSPLSWSSLSVFKSLLYNKWIQSPSSRVKSPSVLSTCHLVLPPLRLQSQTSLCRSWSQVKAGFMELGGIIMALITSPAGYRGFPRHKGGGKEEELGDGDGGEERGYQKGCEQNMAHLEVKTARRA